MPKLNSGLAHLVHHLGPHYEWCYDFEERVEYIESNKPAVEIPIRLKWFTIIPPDRLPLKLREATAAYGKATAAYGKARDIYGKARDAYDKAVMECADELALLHAELFPDCPWDEGQQTMFPQKED